MKYNVLIDKLSNGGIKFPDFNSLLETQKIMWIKRLIEETPNNGNLYHQCTYLKLMAPHVLILILITIFNQNTLLLFIYIVLKLGPI